MASTWYSLGIERFPTNAATKAGLGSLLNGASYLLFVIACMAFWFGGGLIRAVTQTDRVLAESEGIGLAMLFGGIGAFVKAIATGLETGGGMISLSDSLRKSRHAIFRLTSQLSTRRRFSG